LVPQLRNLQGSDRAERLLLLCRTAVAHGQRARPHRRHEALQRGERRPDLWLVPVVRGFALSLEETKLIVERRRALQLAVA
jgi:hypothetical protein